MKGQTGARAWEVTEPTCYDCGSDKIGTVVDEDYSYCPDCEEDKETRLIRVVPESRLQEVEAERDEAQARAEDWREHARQSDNLAENGWAAAASLEATIARAHSEVDEIIADAYNDGLANTLQRLRVLSALLSQESESERSGG